MSGGRTARWVTLLLLALATALWLLVAAIHPQRSVTDAVVAVALMGAATLLHLVVHEAAHALTARALGIGVPAVELGDGPALLRLRLGRTVVRVAGMHSGLTRLEVASTHRLRPRLAAVLAAGPLANLAVAAIAYALLWPAQSDLAGWVLLFLIASGVAIGVLNLVPMTVRNPSGDRTSDGAGLLALARMGPGDVERLAAASRLDAAQRRHRDGDPVTHPTTAVAADSSDPVVLGLEGSRRIFTGEHGQAVQLLRRAAALPQDDETRAMSLNNLAWTLLLARPDGWLAEADRASAEALAIAADADAVASTRGCVLVRLGRPEEGRALLRRADLSAAGPRDRVVVHRHRLEAEHACGDLYAARTALLALLDDGADPAEVDSARRLLRDAEVDRALATLVDANGRLRWPDTRRGSTESRHVAEMRRALASFVDHCADDARHERVRSAMG